MDVMLCKHVEPYLLNCFIIDKSDLAGLDGSCSDLVLD